MRRVAIGLSVVVVALAGALMALRASQRSWEVEGPARWPMRGLLMRLADGRSLRVWCMGTGSPLIVLEASGLGGADSYERLMRLLSERATVCASDRAGFGYSDERTSEPTIAAYAADLWSVTQQPHTGPVILVGASYGGLVAQYAARQHPDEVGALVMLDSVGLDAFGALEKPWLALDGAIDQAERAATPGLLRQLDPLKLGDSREAWLTYRASTWRGVRALISTRHRAKDEFAKLPPLTSDLPMLVLRHDRVGDLLGPSSSLDEHQALEPAWQAAQQKLAAQSSRGKLVVVPDAGHLIALDQPEFVAEQLTTFLAESPSR